MQSSAGPGASLDMALAPDERPLPSSTVSPLTTADVLEIKRFAEGKVRSRGSVGGWPWALTPALPCALSLSRASSS